MPRQARLLTLDRGNSTFDCYDHAAGVRSRFAVDVAGEAAAVQFALHARPDRCVGASVVCDGLAALSAALLGGRCPVLLAGNDLPCPLSLDYEPPSSLGVDRWLGALAAHRHYGRAIVVDCGSATTVNLVDDGGRFRGGAIAPGLRALVSGMLLVTPALPKARLDGQPQMPPRSSLAAVDAGVLLGFCGMVERLVADSHRVLGGAAQLVITGGNAAVLLAHSRLRGVHVDDLVHQGLAILDQESACGS